jgi:hypothetical protein
MTQRYLMKSKFISKWILLYICSLLVTACDAASMQSAATPTAALQRPTSYQQVATISVPGSDSQNWEFDASFIDGSTYYLPDRTARTIDVIDLQSNKFLNTFGGPFTGLDPSGTKRTNGPNHVVKVKEGLMAVSNGDSTVQFLEQQSGNVITSVSTKGQFRADGLAFDARDHLLAVVNPNDDVPFVSFIDTQTLQLLRNDKISFPESVVTDGGIDSITFDVARHEFMLAVTKTEKYANGAIYAIDATSKQVVHQYALSVPCNPSGVTAVPPVATVAVACAAENSVILHLNGDTAQSATVDKAAETDAADYVNGFYFFAGDTHLTIANADGKVIQQITVATNSHSVVADPHTGKVYVPQRGIGLVVYEGK